MLRNLAHISWLLTAIAVFGLGSNPAFAQATVCPGEPGADFDGDGFDDTLECNPSGIPMLPGLQVEVFDPATGTVVLADSLPSCFGQLSPDRRYCTSAEQSDMFVIVVPSDPSGLPSGPVSALSLPIAAGGLGVNSHLVVETGDPGNRTVSPSSSQKALRLTESRDRNGEVFGQASYGTLNNIDRATIWTARIEDFVASKCADDDSCRTDATDPAVTGIGGVTEALKRWVIDHEIGHTLKLSSQYNKRFGGYHLKAGDDSIMTQFVGYSTNKKTGLTTFSIPETFDAQSQADAKLAN